jgi:hypothetical protein
VKIFLGILSSSNLSRWSSQLILCPFIHFTIFSPLLDSSRFVLLLPFPIFIFNSGVSRRDILHFSCVVSSGCQNIYIYII